MVVEMRSRVNRCAGVPRDVRTAGAYSGDGSTSPADAGYRSHSGALPDIDEAFSALPRNEIGSGATHNLTPRR